MRARSRNLHLFLADVTAGKKGRRGLQSTRMRRPRQMFLVDDVSDWSKAPQSKACTDAMATVDPQESRGPMREMFTGNRSSRNDPAILHAIVIVRHTTPHFTFPITSPQSSSLSARMITMPRLPGHIRWLPPSGTNPHRDPSCPDIKFKLRLLISEIP